MRYLLLALVAIGGLGASAALATDFHPPHHPTEPHPGLPHPPVAGVPCDALHPCAHPPTTVTVTTPAQTVTVERPAPPPAIVTTLAPPAVTITTPPTIRTRTITKTVVKWRTRTVTKWRTKVVTRVVCPDPLPQPKIKGCEGDCKKVFEGANG
jgi:hypothetical protein